MGINKLWNIIDQCGETIEISRFAAAHFKREKRTLRIAVDEATWRFKTFVPIKKASTVRADLGKEQSIPELNEENTRTCIQKLLNLNIQLIFIADGTPPIEKGRGSKPSQFGRHQQNSLKKVLHELGVPWHQAPGEAEAECAYLQQWGIVDAVWTEDGDALMFGCTLLIRFCYSVNKIKDSDKIRVFSAQAIQTRYEKLDRYGLVLFAVLSGGDYGEKLPKCTSLQALRAVGMNLGKELCQASSREHFKKWRNNLALCFQILRYEVQIPRNFPSARAVYLYTHPVTSTEEDLRALASAWFPTAGLSTSLGGDSESSSVGALEQSTPKTTSDTDDPIASSAIIDSAAPTSDSPANRKRKFPIFEDATQKNASNEKQHTRNPTIPSESSHPKTSTQRQRKASKSQRTTLHASPPNKLCFRQSKPHSQPRAKDSLPDSDVPLPSNPEVLGFPIPSTNHEDEKKKERQTQNIIQYTTSTGTKHTLNTTGLFTSSPPSQSSQITNPDPSLPLSSPTSENPNSITYEYPKGVFTKMDLSGVFSSSPTGSAIASDDLKANANVNGNVDADAEIITFEGLPGECREVDVSGVGLSARGDEEAVCKRDGDGNGDASKIVVRYPEYPVGPYLEMDFQGFFTSSQFS